MGRVRQSYLLVRPWQRKDPCRWCFLWHTVAPHLEWESTCVYRRSVLERNYVAQRFPSPSDQIRISNMKAPPTLTVAESMLAIARASGRISCYDVIRRSGRRASPPNLNPPIFYFTWFRAKPPNLNTANISGYTVFSFVPFMWIGFPIIKFTHKINKQELIFLNVTL